MDDREERTPDRPTQAVILAGGRGTRLAPLTDTVPKPMIGFHGKPFLEYLIEMLRDQGFERVLLLLGYRAAQVQEHFGDGAAFGVEIEYSVSAEEHDTGRRVKIVQDRIDPLFLLLYCDNYWPMPFPTMWEQFRQYASGEVLAQVTVYRNRDGYTRDNLIVDDEQRLTLYDKSRSAPRLAGVDIGFFLMRREVLELLPDDNVSLEKTLYPRLIQKRQLAAFVTDHRYYSVGSHERLPLTDRFLQREPTIILDRDGVLNAKAPRAQYVCSWDDWEWLPGSAEAVCLLKRAGWRVLLVSNQAGIARGMMSHSDLDDIHQHMNAELARHGGGVDQIYVCPHGWDEGCECRKPKPGMLFQAQRDHCLDLSRVPFFGDDERDLEAGEAAGCPTLLVDSGRSLLDLVRQEVLCSVE